MPAATGPSRLASILEESPGSVTVLATTATTPRGIAVRRPTDARQLRTLDVLVSIEEDAPVTQLTPLQSLAVTEEMRTAALLIQVGLVELNKLDGANDFSHLPLQLLAQGFERLMKLVFCLGSLNEAGTLPAPREVRDLGHDLLRLRDRVAALIDGVGLRNVTPLRKGRPRLHALRSVLRASRSGAACARGRPSRMRVTTVINAGPARE